jgi:hypothetical protein
MPFEIYIDGSPETYWIGRILPDMGCIWTAPEREGITEAAPGAIAAYHTWLRSHGEPQIPCIRAEEISVTVKEVREVPRFGISGAAVGLFGPDHAPVTDEDIATLIRRLGYARLDLLNAVGALSSGELHRRPPAGERTIAENLLHIRNCYFFYLSRILGQQELERQLPPPWPEPLFESLHWAMERSTRILLELPEKYRAGIFPARDPQEDWTPRKMLRRFLEHEREHLNVIRRVIEQR